MKTFLFITLTALGAAIMAECGLYYIANTLGALSVVSFILSPIIADDIFKE